MRGARAPAKPHDLEPIVKLARVNAPKQARSEKRLQEIIQALESLLDGRAFEEITIPDIAQRADCVPASIYARFKDKTSILVALHESLRDRQIARIDQSMRPERFEKLSLDETILAICRDLAGHYARQRNLLRPAFLLGDEEIYRRAATVIRHASEKIAGIVRLKLGASDKALDRSIDFATRAAYALLQQRMVFHPLAPGRYAPATEAEVAAELALLFRQSIAAATPE